MMIPTIETERLLLRGYRNEDFDAYAAMWADPVVTRFIGGKPISREASWVRFLRQLGMWQARGFGFWVVADKATGEFLGEAGFHDLKREIEPSIEGALEAGWGFVPSAHGKGIATEVVGAIVGWGEKNRPDMRMVCIIDPDNKPSRRVAEKYGFYEVVHTTYHGAPTVLFQRRG
jgi:RimJ/RimL family protein N-acetyltransferase